MEKLSSQEKAPHFKFPSFEDEEGEIERVGKHFEFTQENFIEMFIERAQESKLTELSEQVWGSLENTDSYEVEKGDWSIVAEHADAHDPKRDWEGIKSKLENKVLLDAPIIAKVGSTFHLVSGNTRLMVSRALSIIPQVLIVDVTNLN